MQLVRLSRAMADVLVERPSAFATTFGWTVVPGYLDFPEVLPALRDALPAGDPPRYAGIRAAPEIAHGEAGPVWRYDLILEHPSSPRFDAHDR